MSTSASTYDIYQQVFGLSLASNAVGKYKNTATKLQEALQAALPVLLSRLDAQWEVVWGPVIWKNKPDDTKTGPDNAWYIARAPTAKFEDGTEHDTYVIAIAGTATKYDWDEEDLAVGAAVDWTAWVNSGGRTLPTRVLIPNQKGTYLARGTGQAIHRLFNATAPPPAAGAGLTISAFLAGIARTPDTRVIFTGHSLGGGLSPCLAVTSVQIGKLPTANVLTYPTAGPSPGNGAFKAQFAAMFPPRGGPGYRAWNCNIINTMDIVPQAWCTSRAASSSQNLHNIPTMYGSPAVDDVAKKITALVGKANLSLITYIPLQSSKFTGAPPKSVPTTTEAFLKEAMLQHLREYSQLFGMPLPALPPIGKRQAGKEMSEEGIERTIPVFSAFLALSQATEGGDSEATEAE